MEKLATAVEDAERVVALLNGDRTALTEAGCFVETTHDDETIYFLVEEQYQQLRRGEFPMAYWEVLEARIKARQAMTSDTRQGE